MAGGARTSGGKEPELVLLAVDDGVPETSFLCAPHTLIRADGKPRLSSSQTQEPCSLYSGEVVLR